MKNLLIVLMLLGGCAEPRVDFQDPWWTEEDRSLILKELERTTLAVKSETTGLSENQWSFREDSSRWNIAEIVEHLEMQNQLHYREISVTSRSPRYLKFRKITNGQDSHFTKYATDPNPGKAQWFLEPKGKFCHPGDGLAAFLKARLELSKLVSGSTIDLRKQFTFRTEVAEKEVSELKIGEVRDLHQLLLTGIAHTDRHLEQIKRIKSDPDYPIK